MLPCTSVRCNKSGPSSLARHLFHHSIFNKDHLLWLWMVLQLELVELRLVDGHLLHHRGQRRWIAEVAAYPQRRQQHCEEELQEMTTNLAEHQRCLCSRLGPGEWSLPVLHLR